MISSPHDIRVLELRGRRECVQDLAHPLVNEGDVRLVTPPREGRIIRRHGAAPCVELFRPTASGAVSEDRVPAERIVLGARVDLTEA